MSLTITVTAERGNGVWVLESSNGAVSQVRSLAKAEEEILEAVAYLAGVPASEVEIDLRVSTPDGFHAAIEASKQLRREAECANQRSAEQLRIAARSLVDAGLSYRDAAFVMGVSHQRVAQLAHAG